MSWVTLPDMGSKKNNRKRYILNDNLKYNDMKYYGNFSTSDGTMLSEHIRGNCRHLLNKELRGIAMGNRQPGQSASWFVQDLKGRMAFEGQYIPNVGIRYSVFNYQNRTR